VKLRLVSVLCALAMVLTVAAAPAAASTGSVASEPTAGSLLAPSATGLSDHTGTGAFGAWGSGTCAPSGGAWGGWGWPWPGGLPASWGAGCDTADWSTNWRTSTDCVCAGYPGWGSPWGYPWWGMPILLPPLPPPPVPFPGTGLAVFNAGVLGVRIPVLGR
jgi:hypothetical protein